jgi:hypothetical protein
MEPVTTPDAAMNHGECSRRINFLESEYAKLDEKFRLARGCMSDCFYWAAQTQAEMAKVMSRAKEILNETWPPTAMSQRTAEDVCSEYDKLVNEWKERATKAEADVEVWKSRANKARVEATNSLANGLARDIDRLRDELDETIRSRSRTEAALAVTEADRQQLSTILDTALEFPRRQIDLRIRSQQAMGKLLENLQVHSNEHVLDRDVLENARLSLKAMVEDAGKPHPHPPSLLMLPVFNAAMKFVMEHKIAGGPFGSMKDMKEKELSAMKAIEALVAATEGKS